jgi:DNA-binding response OmpR family regulator
MAKKILIVDDDADTVLLLASRLRANKFDVMVAHDAVQAVDKAIHEKPDLILLDMKMPAGGGISVMDSLRNSAETVLIPVIVITAYPSLELQRQVKEMGAIGFISKPFTAEDLLPRIRKTLGEASRDVEG